MSTPTKDPDLEEAAQDAADIFARAIGVSQVEYRLEQAGTETFLKFVVGRALPLYDHALRTTQKMLPPESPFRGLMGLNFQSERVFPRSLEADVLQAIITRETRRVAQRERVGPLSPANISFQNGEDLKVIQPATHLILGRRGVGKSTLILRAVELLEKAKKVCVVMDMQAYSELVQTALYREVLHDFARKLAESMEEKFPLVAQGTLVRRLRSFSEAVLDGETEVSHAQPELNRLLRELTVAAESDVFVFLDDYHVLDAQSQPQLLHVLHGALKGANGWLKVAGLRTRLNAYDPTSRKGLQLSGGDAQEISLDFTLVDPVAAEGHLRTILQRFLKVVGISSEGQAIHDAPFRRLVWANAGVPRDFLQMFAASLEQARRANREKVTLTDVNLSIGEFGQTKMDEMERDARNEQNMLKRVMDFLEVFCLEKNKLNGFLIRSEQSRERQAVEILSDLRLVHLIHKTITPHKAGERYQAYLLDYSRFTGFRRRPGIAELLPNDGRQFKAKELRRIPELPMGFLSPENSVE
jgi:energy-coupling factor transporter ATP-binding protein EcfA2